MLLVFERRILRKIYGRVMDEETGEWRIRHNVELLELSGMPPITSYIRAQRLRWIQELVEIDSLSATSLLFSFEDMKCKMIIL